MYFLCTVIHSAQLLPANRHRYRHFSCWPYRLQFVEAGAIVREEDKYRDVKIQ